ncbi:beta-alanine transporter-like [Haemaphysalis longicornis]
MASTPSRAASRAMQASVSRLESPASGSPTPTRTTRTQDTVPAEQGEDSAEANVLPGFLKADSPTALTDNVYVILGHGRYQIFVACSFVLSAWMVLAHVLAYQLIGRRVGHWCRRPDYLRYLSQEAWRNVAIPLLPDGTLSGCTVYDPPVEVLLASGDQRNLFFQDRGEQQGLPSLGGEGAERHEVPCREWDYDDKGYPDSIVGMWNLVCDRQWLYQFSFFLYMVGPVFSAPVAGAMADRFGRRPVIIALLWVFSFASIVSAIANSFFMFLTARLVISATSYAAFALLFILLYEVTDNEHRAILAFVSSAVGLTLMPPAVHVVSWLQPSWPH